MDIKAIRTYGAIAVSVLVTLAFGVALVLAYVSKDQPNLALLIGAVIAQFSGVVSFWVGSSASSQQKDEALTEAAKPK